MDLTATEYAVLYELAGHAPKALTHSVLQQRVWGPERVGEAWLWAENRRRVGQTQAVAGIVQARTFRAPEVSPEVPNVPGVWNSSMAIECIHGNTAKT